MHFLYIVCDYVHHGLQINILRSTLSEKEMIGKILYAHCYDCMQYSELTLVTIELHTAFSAE